MLRIGICDDEKIIQDELKDMVSHIVFQYGEVEFSTFSAFIRHTYAGSGWH